MEIIVEIILQLAAWVLEIFGELFLQLIVEGIAELLGHSVKARVRPSAPRREPRSPWLAALAYLILGALAGLLSLWLVPEVFIKSYWLRLANLFFTPLASGLIMAWIGAWRRRNDKKVLHLETFACGFCFALAMGMVRFVWGRVVM